ncbi:MAG: dihydroorotase [Bdellovibrionales bacterium]
MKLTKSNSFVIENVAVWTPQYTQPSTSLWIEEGAFRGFGADSSSTQVMRFNASGKVLIPSGIDAQTHLRVPGQAHKETPETGLTAALRGGYAAVLTMPNTQPTIDSVEVLEKGRQEVAPFEERFGVKVLWTAAITRSLNSNEMTPYEELAKAGVRAFTNDGLGVMSDQVMEQAFSRLEMLNVPLLQHAEFLGHAGSLAPGSIQKKVGAKPYPDEPEWQMVERDLRELRRHPDARYHVLHVSSRRTLDLIRMAKKEGLRVTAEVTPHHLFFNTETISPDNTSFKMNPPIRSPEDQQALWEALADGTLDFVSTDHAPHEASMKKGPFDQVAFGTLGLETTLRVLLYGVQRGLISQTRLVQVFSSEPARFLGLPPAYGDWHTGEEFHAVLLNAESPAQPYTEAEISSLSKNSCFTGCALPGKIVGAFHGSRVFQF